MLFVIASAVTFFDTLLIVILVFYGARLFFRYFGPRVVEKAADKIYQDMRAQEEARRKQGNQESGNITVERTSQKDKSYRRGDGEYVDFEEIK